MKKILKWSAIAIILITIISLMIVYKPTIDVWIKEAVRYIGSNKTTGSLLYLGFLLLHLMFLLPITVPTIIAGVLFELPIAISLVLTGYQISIVISYFIGQGFLRSWVHKKKEKLQVIDLAVEKHGWVLVFLLRVAPVIPYGLGTYVFSATYIKLYTLMGASLIGDVPLVYLLCSVGKSSGYGSSNSIPLKWQYIIGLVSICVCIISTVYISYIWKEAKNELIKEIEMVEVGIDSKEQSLDTNRKWLIAVCIIFGTVIIVGCPLIFIFIE